MNTVLRTMWPYYNHAIGQQTLEQVNPIIAEQLKPVCPLACSTPVLSHNASFVCA